MPALDLETLELFLFFVVPGFVALKTYELVMPTDAERVADSIVSLVSFSMINLGVMSWLILLLSGQWPARPLLYVFGVFAVVIVSPVLLALGWWKLHAFLADRGWVLHPMPTAWDYFFSARKTLWVLIHLKTGEKYGGFFGRRSHASAYPTPESLYLETAWRLTEKGEFLEPVPRSEGLMVRYADCHLIEFFSPERGSDVRED